MGASTKVVSASAGQEIDITVHNHHYRGMLVQILDDFFDQPAERRYRARQGAHRFQRHARRPAGVSHRIRFEVTTNTSNNYTYAISSDRCY
jgi:hypothetical protein